MIKKKTRPKDIKSMNESSIKKHSRHQRNSKLKFTGLSIYNCNTLKSAAWIKSQTINKSLARLLFPGMENPITRELTTIGPDFDCIFNYL